MCCYLLGWKSTVGGRAGTDVTALVYLACLCTTGPFFPPQTPFLHVLVAVGHKLDLKTGLWTVLDFPKALTIWSQCGKT